MRIDRRRQMQERAGRLGGECGPDDPHARRAAADHVLRFAERAGRGLGGALEGVRHRLEPGPRAHPSAGSFAGHSGSVGIGGSIASRSVTSRKISRTGGV